MKKALLLTPLFLSVLALVLFTACKKKNKGTGNEPSDSTFDKQAMLINYADNLIIPAYLDFKISLDSLVLSYEKFKSSDAQDDFQLVKQKLHVAYVHYQRISLFGLGPGDDAAIRSNFNVFPTNVSLINSNISSGTYNLEAVSNLSAKGFPALDYLFFGSSSEADQRQLFVSNIQRKNYVDDLLQDMQARLNTVLNAWNSSYRSTFINSLGTDVGSSIGFLVNQINYELDYLKNAKFGIPLGLKSGGIILPGHCEAYYETESMRYAIETLRILEDVYQGNSSKGANGLGFDDYLSHLDIKNSEGSLNTAINNQFSRARTKLLAIANPLSEKIVSDPGTVNAGYKELVKLLVLLKTDMPSNLGVVITYQDGDGD